MASQYRKELWEGKNSFNIPQAAALWCGFEPEWNASFLKWKKISIGAEEHKIQTIYKMLVDAVMDKEIVASIVTKNESTASTTHIENDWDRTRISREKLTDWFQDNEMQSDFFLFRRNIRYLSTE